MCVPGQGSSTPRPLGFSPVLQGASELGGLSEGGDEDGHSNESYEDEGNLRNVLSLNGTLVLWFLGIAPPSHAALAWTTASMCWVVRYAQEVLAITGPNLHPLRPLLAIIGVSLVQLLGPEDAA